MENHSDNVTYSAPLFIKEGDAEPSEASGGNLLQRSLAQSDHTFMGMHLGQTLSIGPYLKEMDDLLNNCESLTGINKSTWNETNVSSQEYMSTHCMETEDDSRAVQPEDFGFDKCGAEARVSSSMPLMSAGNKLSESMSEYESQLVDMLTKLESCEEDSSMDYRPQDWSQNEEYVHIPKLFKETAKTPLESSKSAILEAQAVAINFSKQQDNTSEVYSRKRAARPQTQNVHNCENARMMTMQSPEKSYVGDNIVKVQVELKPLLWTNTKQMMCEETRTDEECNDKAADNSDPFNEAKVDMTALNCTVSEIESLRPKLDECIDEVQSLVQKRKELQAEVMNLCGYFKPHTTETNEEEEEPTSVKELILKLKAVELLQRKKSTSEIENLRIELAEEERKLWRVNVERQGLHGELWRLKKKLFVVARECAQSQSMLRAQQQHVDLLKKGEEKQQAAEVQLREDYNKLQLEHEQQLLNLQEKLNLVTSRHLSSTQEELGQCRKETCSDVQQYLQESLKAVEERYGPILMALLKRRDTAVDALAKVKEQAQELRAQITPLREETQRLMLQKVCLEEKLRLICFKRKEEMGQYKERVNSLEERCREIKRELRIQNRKTNEMKELKEILDKELTAFRSAVEDHVDCDKETT
ncbi:uncharacterized protein sync [Eucyclogobius newberryi]|uniref:uncharacterized protein sync n=1 Tax=Eucyclogobius newberryi TaxID=166745 RepID=UPI003B5CD3BA